VWEVLAYSSDFLFVVVFQITNWQWSTCTPTISSSFEFDNVIRIDFSLPTNAQPSWISGFQVSTVLRHLNALLFTKIKISLLSLKLYLNGVPYGGWLCASCPGVQLSGLTGGRIYHVVIIVFPAHEEFSPQLSNELVRIALMPTSVS
jgi:hypothetical protein